MNAEQIKSDLYRELVNVKNIVTNSMTMSHYPVGLFFSLPLTYFPSRCVCVCLQTGSLLSNGACVFNEH